MNEGRCPEREKRTCLIHAGVMSGFDPDQTVGLCNISFLTATPEHDLAVC